MSSNDMCRHVFSGKLRLPDSQTESTVGFPHTVYSRPFVHDHRGVIDDVARFKPKDEEAFAPNNPRGYVAEECDPFRNRIGWIRRDQAQWRSRLNDDHECFTPLDGETMGDSWDAKVVSRCSVLHHII